MKQAAGLCWAVLAVCAAGGGVCRAQSALVGASPGQGDYDGVVRAADPPAERVRVPAGAMALLLDSSIPPQTPGAGPYGTVLVHAWISKEGAVETASAIGGPRELQTAALDAVKQWRYHPFTQDGHPMEVDTTILVNFAGR